MHIMQEKIDINIKIASFIFLIKNRDTKSE